MVLCARRLTWSRELALTSLVARSRVSPFGKLLYLSPSRARGLLLSNLSFFVEDAMTVERKLRPAPVAEPLRVTHRHAAGIDIHANSHWVAVPPEEAPAPPADHPPHLPAHVRSFGTCTAD